MNIEEFREYCLSLSDVTEATPFEKFSRGKFTILVFYVNSHMFCYFNVDDFSNITIKCNPTEMAELKETYQALGEPFNGDKRYWISVQPNMDLPDEELKELVRNSYEIVKKLKKMNSKMDPMGRAIADYHKTKKASKLRVFSPMFEEDEIPLTTLFRSYKSMPVIERKALDMAKGRVLDVGAGSGCHSLVLQERGVDVTAIDISPLSVETMKERGIKKVFEQDFFTLDGQYDTILILMNGIGIVGTLERMSEFFKQLDKILAPGGQVLCDSSDISYVFETEDGIIELPDDMVYYGEHSFQMQYKNTIGEPFKWLYIDADTLKEKASRSGYAVEVVAEGEHYDYLARITKK